MDKPDMNLYDAVYVGNGEARVYREIAEGEQFRLYIPPELMADWKKHNPNAEIHVDQTNPDGRKV